MDEQPVALATSVRSPKSCVSELQVGRLPAARAGPRVLEERLQELRASRLDLDLRPIGLGQPRKNA